MPNKAQIAQDDQTRELLSILSAPSIQGLQKISTKLRTHPQSFGTHVTRLEATLLSLVNCKEMSCSRQNSVHQHFPPTATTVNDKLLSSASTCFAMLPFLGNPLRRADRFIDFQMRLLYCLCQSSKSLLDFHGVPSPSLKPICTYLDSKTGPFVSLKTVSKDSIPSPEYAKLLLARIDFFTGSLRSFFESGLNIEVPICLPLFIAFYSGLLSVEQIATKHGTNDFLLRIGRLLNGLAALIRLVGANIIPASSSLFTLLTYQLEWTAIWRESSVINEGIAQLRLASLQCLREVILSVRSFHSSRLVHLLPRILSQLVQDITWVCNVHTSATILDDTDQCMSDSGDSVQPKRIPPLAVKRRLLAASFELIELLFSDAAVTFAIRLPHNHPSVHPETQENDNNIKREVSRLQFSLSQVSRYIASNFPGGIPFKRPFWSGSRNLPLLHPVVLSALARCLFRIVCTTGSTFILHTTFNLLTELSLHPDSELSSVAQSCLQRLGAEPPKVGSELSWNLPQNCVYAPVPNKVSINGPSKAPSVPAVLTQSITPPLESKEVSNDVKQVSQRFDSSTLPSDNTEPREEICTESEPKRRCILQDDESSEALTTSQTPASTVITPSATTSLDKCLASFDPTFV